MREKYDLLHLNEPLLHVYKSILCSSFPSRPLDVDHVEITTDFTFSPGISRLCVNVPIVNDDILEGNEDFFTSLTTTDAAVILNPDEAMVSILEDPTDGKSHSKT